MLMKPTSMVTNTIVAENTWLKTKNKSKIISSLLWFMSRYLMRFWYFFAFDVIICWVGWVWGFASAECTFGSNSAEGEGGATPVHQGALSFKPHPILLNNYFLFYTRWKFWVGKFKANYQTKEYSIHIVQKIKRNLILCYDVYSHFHCFS